MVVIITMTIKVSVESLSHGAEVAEDMRQLIQDYKSLHDTKDVHYIIVTE